MPKGRRTGVAGEARNQSGGMARVAGAGVENVDRQRGAVLEGIQRERSERWPTRLEQIFQESEI